MFDKNIYKKRREILKNKFNNGIIILAGNENSPLDCKDNCYHFIQDSTFKYYFGISHPGLFGVIDIDNNKEIIFGKEYTIDDIIWMGKQNYLNELSKMVGCEFQEITELKNYIFSKKNTEIHYTNTYKEDILLSLCKILEKDIENFNKNISYKLIKAIIEQRSIKTEEEIEELEKAANVTVSMHEEALKKTISGKYEYEIVADIEAAAKREKCYTSFNTIFSKNGEILHNHLHNNKLNDGDLVLLDCGAKNEEGYCGDMTTTFPVSFKFTERQKIIHDIVSKMFDRALELVRPGITYKEVHIEVCKILVENFKKLNLLFGETDKIVLAGAHALFMPHGLGHMLGMDAHDMENFGEDLVGYDENTKREKTFGISALRLGKELKEGNVLTIEPGIYFIPDLFYKWKNENKFSEFLNYNEIEKFLDFGGIRSERDILVTKDGCRILGRYLPRKSYEIEEYISKFR